MKKFFLFLFISTFLGAILLCSCKKVEPSPVTPAPINRAPVANAGADQMIVLPQDSVTLNGTASIGNGNKIFYAWAKISGPNCVIVYPDSAKTIVQSLVQGVYQFALKVTDDKGASTKDAVLITVSLPFVGTPVCNDASINIVNGSGTFTSLGSLSVLRYVEPVSAADKIVFGGGYTGGDLNPKPSDQVDIYNLSNNTWSTATIPQPGKVSWSTATGNKIVMQVINDPNASGLTNVFETYDASTNIFSAIQMNYKVGGRPVASNNQLFFGSLFIAPVGTTYSRQNSCKVWKFGF